MEVVTQTPWRVRNEVREEVCTVDEHAVPIEWNVEPSPEFLLHAEDHLSAVIAGEPALG
jgi:hypothetical protein